MDDPQNRLVVLNQRDVDGKFAVAFDEFLGAIQWVDNPVTLPLTAHVKRRQLGLLAEYRYTVEQCSQRAPGDSDREDEQDGVDRRLVDLDAVLVHEDVVAELGTVEARVREVQRDPGGVEHELVVLFQIDETGLEMADANLRPLQVAHQSDVAFACGGGRPQRFGACPVVGLITVGEIQSRDVESGLEAAGAGFHLGTGTTDLTAWSGLKVSFESEGDLWIVVKTTNGSSRSGCSRTSGAPPIPGRFPGIAQRRRP